MDASANGSTPDNPTSDGPGAGFAAPSLGTRSRPARRVLGIEMGIEYLFGAEEKPKREQVVGWGLIDMGTHEVVACGTLFSKPPQNPKSKANLAADRRGARSVRKGTKRRRDRRTHVLRALVAHGVLPEGTTGDDLRPRRGDRQVLELRVKALDSPLEPRELARICFSAAGRRGYIPHGEGASGADAEARKVLKALEANRAEIELSGARTVGEWLAGKPKSRNAAGDYSLCVPNELVMEELHAIFSRQRGLGNALATESLEHDVCEAIQWEKYDPEYDERVYSRVSLDLYGLEDEEGRPLRAAALATLSSERCRALEALKNLAIARADGSVRWLTNGEVTRCMATLFSPTRIKGNRDCLVTYARLRRALRLSEEDEFKGVDPDREAKDEPMSPKAWRRVREALYDTDEALLSRMLSDHELGDEVTSALAFASSLPSLRERLARVEGLSDRERAALERVPFASKAFSGYGTRSAAALRMLADALEEEGVDSLWEAEAACGLSALRTDDGSGRSGLLGPYREFDPNVTNPTVDHGMAMLRRVVNSVIRTHGMPDRISVMVNRELRWSKARQDKERLRNAKRRRSREEAAAQVADALGIPVSDVTDTQVAKHELWVWQGGCDLYTGTEVDYERMLADSSYAAVNLALPYSRCGDRSRANQVLCLMSSALAKGKRTPYEWMGRGGAAPDWDAYVTRVKETCKWQRKADKLLETKLDERVSSSCFGKLFAESAYASKAATKWVSARLALPEEVPDRVMSVREGAVDAIGRAWGVVPGGDDPMGASPKGCALRALVVAGASAEALRACARLRDLPEGTGDDAREAALAATEPWPGYPAQIVRAAEGATCVRLASHKVTGCAYKSSTYSPMGTDEDGMTLFMRGGKVDKTSTGRCFEGQGGGVRLLGDVAFLRLYRDAEGVMGRRPGWVACPVYVSDLPDIRAGRFVPRAATTRKAGRSRWPVVDASVAAGTHVDLHAGDLVAVDGEVVGEFRTFDVSSASWSLRTPLTDEAVRGVTIARIPATARIEVVEPKVC